MGDSPSEKTESARRTLEQRYRTLFRVGKGGMGAVEVALERGEGSFQRIVALKRLLPESTGDRRITDMFLREARLGALLSHPNVVRAYDFGEIRGELFLAMEYVEGQTLSSIVKRARERGITMPLAIVAHVLAEACQGLHAAHELRDVNGQALQVVHRDVSPHNVMVSYDGHVKLLDFGVAKIDEAGSNTRTGEIKGKMAYMSPEQAMGEPLDRTSDLWAVGAVLFELASGSRMWGEGTDMDVLRRLALEEPPDLPEAPPGLRSLYRALVARRPGDRPPTARDVAEALHTFLAEREERADEKALRAFVGPLFEDEASTDRARLREALEVAAPEQADELRESLAPSPPPDLAAAPGSTRVADRLAPTAGTATLEAVETSPAEPAPAPRSPRWAIGLGLVAAALVAVAVARSAAPRQVTPPSTPEPAAAAPSAAAIAPPTPGTSVEPAVAPPRVDSSSSLAPPRPSPLAPVVRAPARPLVAVPAERTSATSGVASAAPTPPPPRPSVSAGEVDPAPF